MIINKELSCLFLTGMICVFSTALTASDLENQIPAKEVRNGQPVFEYEAVEGDVLSGFYLRLANGLPPRQEPVVVGLKLNDELLPARVSIPVFSYPLVYQTRPFTHSETFPPLDVALEYREAIQPVSLEPGDRVSVEIVSTAPLQSGIVAGIQLQGRYKLTEMRNPIRDARTNGPVCLIPWEAPEIIAVGTQKKFDPLCAPQNNSSIINDEDGTLYQFTAYYSVDEQYGGGRGGSFSRIYGYRKRPGAKSWEEIGLVVDLMKDKTYSGDPFVFRDLKGTPCLVYTTCDGTNGFQDWKRIDAWLIRSTTDSFEGPWGKPTPLLLDYPREPDDNKTGGRANCIRIYTRQATNDYVFVWNHGAQDMDIRVIILPTLDVPVSHEQINQGTIVVKNQEEGGGGFQYGSKGYYSTWQIPWLNDPNGVQRLYEFDLADADNPEAWRVVPGSLGFNDGTNPLIDGGCTADAWAVSVINDELWATSCQWSVTNGKNYLVACRALLPLSALNLSALNDECKELSFPRSNELRYGAVRTEPYHETVPTIEYALGNDCSLEFDFYSEGELSYGFIGLAPSDQPLFRHGIALEFSPQGGRLVAYGEDPFPIALSDVTTVRWEPGKSWHLKLQRSGRTITAFVDQEQIGPITLEESILSELEKSPRFKLYGWKGGLYKISNAILTDGKE
ncbi:MAG: hypothetical protein Q4C95_02310 [Planctomycetia bacterium]|nr:hypothetical protein [Planctomycetia bacterium]